jgi:hypothetical protein
MNSHKPIVFSLVYQDYYNRWLHENGRFPPNHPDSIGNKKAEVLHKGSLRF